MLIKQPTDCFTLPLTELKRYFKQIGEGGSRHVFDLGNGLILKREKRNPSDANQNRTEIDVFHSAKCNGHASLFCPILAHDDRNILMPIALTTNTFELQTPYNENLLKYLVKSLAIAERVHTVGLHSPNKLRAYFTDKEITEIYNNPIYKSIDLFCNVYDLHPDEVTAPNAWGILQNNFVLLDYGLLYKELC